MKTLDPEPILRSKERPWFELFLLDVPREVAAEWFGCRPHVASVDGLGDADYWIVEFDCGLKVGFEFLHHGKGGSVLATEPVAQHVARHLRHWRDQLHEYPPETFELDRNSMIEQFRDTMPELTELDSYQVWRQGDDGNEARVGFPTSRLDAECWRAELESHGHKQIYWISPCMH